MKVTLFRRYPTALDQSELPDALRSSYLTKEVWRSDGISGVDGITLANAAKELNFKAINVPQLRSDFGYKDWDGNFVGNLTVIIVGNDKKDDNSNWQLN